MNIILQDWYVQDKKIGLNFRVKKGSYSLEVPKNTVMYKIVPINTIFTNKFSNI